MTRVRPMADETSNPTRTTTPRTPGIATVESPPSEDYGIVGSEVCTAVVAVLAVAFAFYPMDTLLLKVFALILILQPCFVSIGFAIERKRLIRIERVARNETETSRV